MKSAVVIFARMGSTRLPGKALRKIAGRELLGHVIDRCKKTGHQVIVATTDQPDDRAIVEYANQNGADVYAPICDPNDVLARARGCAHAFHLDYIARICGDQPFVDPVVIRLLLAECEARMWDICVNADYETERKLVHVEALPIWTLERLHRVYLRTEDREHVTSAIYRNPSYFRIGVTDCGCINSETTVDTEADLVRAEQLIAEGKITW